jgi:hypothetical protein
MDIEQKMVIFMARLFMNEDTLFARPYSVTVSQHSIIDSPSGAQTG